MTSLHAPDTLGTIGIYLNKKPTALLYVDLYPYSDRSFPPPSTSVTISNHEVNDSRCRKDQMVFIHDNVLKDHLSHPPTIDYPLKGPRELRETTKVGVGSHVSNRDRARHPGRIWRGYRNVSTRRIQSELVSRSRSCVRVFLRPGKKGELL